MEQLIEFFLYLIIVILAVPTSIIMGIVSIISEFTPMLVELWESIIGFF